MQRIPPPATIFVVAALCTAVAGASADEVPSNPISQVSSAAFAKLADRIAGKGRGLPGASERASAARSVTAGDGPARRFGRPARADDLGAALDRLKATDRIGLRKAYQLGPDGASLGLRIPLSEKTAIVPTYDLDHRDIGLAGTDGDRAHRFRIGASLHF